MVSRKEGSFMKQTTTRIKLLVVGVLIGVGLMLTAGMTTAAKHIFAQRLVRTKDGQAMLIDVKEGTATLVKYNGRPVELSENWRGTTDHKW
jgi:hypothetical protein